MGSRLPVSWFFLLWWLIAAILKVVQSWLAQITSGFPKLFKISCSLILLISSYRSIFSKSLSHSTLKTSWPLASNALPILLVPANNSNTLIFVHHYLVAAQLYSPVNICILSLFCFFNKDNKRFISSAYHFYYFSNKLLN